MGLRYNETLTPQVDADGIAQSQTPSSGGEQALTLNGVLGTTLNHSSIIEIVSVGDDSGRTFTITGEDDRGLTINESVTGANAGTASSTKYFKVITSITTDDDTADAVTVGVSGLCTSRLFVMDTYRKPSDISLRGDVTLGAGDALTYTFQHTLEDPQVSDLSNLTFFNHEVLASKTADDEGNYAFPVTAIRLIVTAVTIAVGPTVEATVLQAG